MRRRRPWESSDHRSDRPRRGRRFQFQDGTDGAAQHSSKQRPIQLQPQQIRVGSDHELGCVLCRAVRPERVSGSSSSSTASQPATTPTAPGGTRHRQAAAASRLPVPASRGRKERVNLAGPAGTAAHAPQTIHHMPQGPSRRRPPRPLFLSLQICRAPACLPATASTCASSPPAHQPP